MGSAPDTRMSMAAACSGTRTVSNSGGLLLSMSPHYERRAAEPGANTYLEVGFFQALLLKYVSVPLPPLP